MRHLTLYLFIYLIPFFLVGQVENSKWIVRDSFIYEFNGELLYQYDQETNSLISETKLLNVDKIDLDEYDILNYDKIYFYKKTGGLLYQLINNEITRIDNSYDHKLHKHSLKYFYNNTINVIGGYGFFNRRNDIISFSKDKKEWFSTKIKGQFPKEGVSEIFYHAIFNNKLFFYGGVTGDRDDSSISYRINDFYEIDLTTLKSKKSFLEVSKPFQNKPTAYIQIKDVLYLFFDDLLFKINLETFDSSQHKISDSVKKIIGVIDNEISFFSDENQHVSFIKVLNTDSLGRGTQILFFNLFFPKLIISILGGLVLLFLVMNIRKKRSTKIVVGTNEIKINSKVFSTEVLWVEIINLFLEKGQLSNNEILDIIGQNSLNIGHQNRIKKTLIRDINKRAEYLLGENLILEKQRIEDKRMKDYFLNRKFRIIRKTDPS